MRRRLLISLPCATILLLCVINFSAFRGIYFKEWMMLQMNEAGLQIAKAIEGTALASENSLHQLAFATSRLRDKTLAWDPSIRRLWLEPDLKPDQRPPAMLLLSNVGWNQADQKKALTIQRHLRETLLFNAVINHPWFHPTLLEDIEDLNVSIPENVRFYVFTDFYQYRDSHWPRYANYSGNLDKRFNRSATHIVSGVPSIHFGNMKDTIRKTQGRLSKEGHNVTNIFFDASEWGPPRRSRSSNRFNGSMSTLPMSFVCMSALISNVNEAWDQGLIPPALKPANLTFTQMQEIETCEAEKTRSLFFVYNGNGRSGRNSEFHAHHRGGARISYFYIHDNERIFAVNTPLERMHTKLANMTYREMLSKTVFGLASRGDNKYSYRFTEVLSAGAIPVVHADDWVWPFRPELINWNECAVILPEKDAGNRTIQILESISLEQRCKMRQKCWSIYKKYVETPAGTINGIIEGLELVATRGKPEKMHGVRCDDYIDPIDCNMQ